MIDCGPCVLRSWRDDDVNALVAIANDADVARHLASDNFPHPYTRDDARSWILRHKGAPEQYAIEVDGHLAGAIGVFPYSGAQRHVAHIGYWLGKAFWGRGIATAACGCMVKRMFDEAGFMRLETTVNAPNVASARVLEKNGFVLEGRKRAAVHVDDALCDVLVYALLRPQGDAGAATKSTGS